jgi:putative transposase
METTKKYLGKYRRDSQRLNNWDYRSNGIYFISICTKYRSKDFGYVQDQQMHLNSFGEIVQHHWASILPSIYPQIILDDFMIMPDHVHGILHIFHENDCRDVSERLYNKYQIRDAYQGYNPHMSKISAHPGSISTVIRSFKGSTCKEIRKIHPEFTWQRNYHDHIIQSEYELDRIRKYIQENPKNYNNS